MSTVTPTTSWERWRWEGGGAKSRLKACYILGPQMITQLCKPDFPPWVASAFRCARRNCGCALRGERDFNGGFLTLLYLLIFMNPTLRSERLREEVFENGERGYYRFYFSFIPEEYVSSSDICQFGLLMGNNFGCLFSKSETEVLDKKFIHVLRVCTSIVCARYWE